MPGTPYVEGKRSPKASGKVVHRDGAGLGLVETVSKGCRGRLVDDAQHFKAGDLASILGGLTLRVVEIGGNGDDGLIDLLAEMGFGGLFHLLQNERGNLRGRIPSEIPGDVLRALGGPESPGRAIRAKCIDCSGGNPTEARKCVAFKCPLWPFRMGKNPFWGKHDDDADLTADVPVVPA